MLSVDVVCLPYVHTYVHLPSASGQRDSYTRRSRACSHSTGSSDTGSQSPAGTRLHLKHNGRSQPDSWTDGRTYGRTGVRTDGRTGGRVTGRTDELVGRRTDELDCNYRGYGKGTNKQ